MNYVFFSSCTNNLFFRAKRKKFNPHVLSPFLREKCFNICCSSLMPSHQSAKPPRYSSTYEDDMYQYRHVIVDKGMVSLIPKNRLMDECEWRALGVKQGSHWEHYLIHKPGKIVVVVFFLLYLISRMFV